MSFASKRLPAVLLGLLTGTSPATAEPGPTPQIVNGLPTSEWPSVAMLETGEGSCSATLIGCRTVLTAAHCVCSSGGTGPACPNGTFLADPAGMRLYLQHVARPLFVESIRVDPGYAFAVAGDAAVLTLRGPVRSIRPSAINTTARPPFGTAGTIVGFGRTSSGAFDAQIERFGAVSTGSCSGAGVPASTHVCWSLQSPVGPPGSDSTICFGDSGGPLFADLGAGPALAGIHSGGVGLCQVGDASFATDVFVERAWIASERGADQQAFGCGDGPQVGDAQVTTNDFDGTLAGQVLHSFAVPSGTKELRVALNAEVGSAPNDFDLYVRFGSPPTLASFDCAPQRIGSLESCEFSDPAPGTWYALIDAFVGGPGDYQLTVTQLPENPAPPPLATYDLAVADFDAFELSQLARASGDRAVASASLRGSGVELRYPEDALAEPGGPILVTNVGIPALLRVDPLTGNRVVVSGCADASCTSQVGSGPAFLGPRFIAREAGGWLVLSDRAGLSVSAVVRVDPSNGDRTLVSGCADALCSSQLGTGPAFGRIYGIGVEPGGAILVADTRALLRIDPASGNRTVLSGCADPGCTTVVGSGPGFGEPVGVAREAGGDILVTASADASDFSAIFRVDSASGARSVLSGCADPTCSSSVGAGPAFGKVFGIALEANGDLLVTDRSLDAVFHVDAATGDRNVVSGCADTSCASAIGSGTLQSEPLGITLLPEPNAWLSLTTCLAFLALAKRRRR